MSSPDPRGPLSCMFYLFPWSNVHNSVIELPLQDVQKPITDLKLGVLEQKNL